MPHHATEPHATREDAMHDDLAALYHRYADELLGLAYHLTGSRADAEDVLHDVFVGLPEAMRRYEERGRLGAWLRQLVTRTALNAMRTRTRRREDAIDAVAEPAARGAADDGLSALALERAVHALPDSLRQVFVLREVAGYTHAEIASLLGISVTASEVRLSRAMKELRTRLRSS